MRILWTTWGLSKLVFIGNKSLSLWCSLFTHSAPGCGGQEFGRVFSRKSDELKRKDLKNIDIYSSPMKYFNWSHSDEAQSRQASATSRAINQIFSLSLLNKNRWSCVIYYQLPKKGLNVKDGNRKIKKPETTDETENIKRDQH